MVLVVKLANGFEYEMPSFLLPNDEFPDWARAELGPQTRQMFTIITVDCDSATIAGIKAATVSPHFTRALHREIRDRWTQPLSEQEARSAIAAHQQRYPTIKSMLKDAIASTQFGD